MKHFEQQLTIDRTLHTNVPSIATRQSFESIIQKLAPEVIDVVKPHGLNILAACLELNPKLRQTAQVVSKLVDEWTL